MASVIQLIGSVLIVVGVGAWSIPAGLVAAGIFAIAIGVSLERD